MENLVFKPFFEYLKHVCENSQHLVFAELAVVDSETINIQSATGYIIKEVPQRITIFTPLQIVFTLSVALSLLIFSLCKKTSVGVAEVFPRYLLQIYMDIFVTHPTGPL